MWADPAARRLRSDRQWHGWRVGTNEWRMSPTVRPNCSSVTRPDLKGRRVGSIRWESGRLVWRGLTSKDGIKLSTIGPIRAQIFLYFYHKQNSRCYTVVRHMQKINRKMGNSTPCKIVTPKNFNLKLCITSGRLRMHHANFGSNRYSEGFSPYRRNITTLWLFWLACPVLSFFSR